MSNTSSIPEWECKDGSPVQAQAQLWGYVYNPLRTPANGVQETPSTPLRGYKWGSYLSPELRLRLHWATVFKLLSGAEDFL